MHATGYNSTVKGNGIKMGKNFDVVVIGAGPGGYVAAIKAAKLGLKTAVIEERQVGGTCLNRGCIPAKAMIHASSLYREARQGSHFGIHAQDVTFNFEEILQYKEETSMALRSGIEQLFVSNQVEVFSGKAQLLNDHQIQVQGLEEMEIISGAHIILASGSKPIQLPIPGIDLDHVVTSDELFLLREMPKSLLIIGGGVISVEFASVYADLGCQVTIVEALPRIVPNMDKDISQNLKMILKKRGVEIITGAKVQNIVSNGELLCCNYLEKEKEQSVEAEYILSAVGRCPNTDGLFADSVAIEMERGRVVVNAEFETSIPGVYAIGDLIFGAQLAHTASAQGLYVVEKIAGHTPSVSLEAVPGCVYTNPEIASVGLTEEEAKEKEIPVQIGKFMMSANGKSIISKEERGFIKIVAHQESRVILGAQMMCARATDMIGEFVTAVANKLTVEQLLAGMRAHPTYNEAVGEALEEVFGEAIHVATKKKLKV